uniref:Uncharacterized protein n=1 Tax=uncultured bacterium A1Q1_fos_291 TaxID=1256570 RepID=L7VSK6_9BACT|nr:hypothetical protein [uncultured bacterium A1Q1_fos_291]
MWNKGLGAFQLTCLRRFLSRLDGAEKEADHVSIVKEEKRKRHY